MYKKMLYSTLRRGPLLMILPLPEIGFDITEEPQKPGENGLQRVAQIFKRDKFGETSKELQTIVNITYVGGFAGFVVGGLAAAGHISHEFIMNNKATLFTSHLDAKRALQREIVIRFAQGGAKYGIKVAFFCFLYTSITTSISNYARGYSILHHTLGGGITGLCFKLNMGLKGAFAGTVAGAAIGTIGGTLISLLLYISGMSMEDFQERNQSWVMATQKPIKEREIQAAEDEIPGIKELYELNVKSKDGKENAIEIVDNKL